MRRASAILPLAAGVSFLVHVGAFALLTPARKTSATRDHVGAAPAGTTFELAPPDPPADPDEELAARNPETNRAAPDLPETGETGDTRERSGIARRQASSRPASSSALYGAVGVRFATDLATTFTRALPQAASTDGAWETAPLGGAGSAEVTLVLDDAGRLVSPSIGAGPGPLRHAVVLTLALIGHRLFTSTEKATRLRVTARISRDQIHDGLHGDVFALSGGSFAGEVGTAFFALPGTVGAGRRVDVEVRLSP